MTHLLSISIGPVQDFIAAARKTRDLHNGSELLSKVAGSVAKSLQCAGADLIFPSTSDGSAPNKIVCTVTTDPAEAAQRARQAAEAYISRAAEDAISRIEQKHIAHCFDLDMLRKQCAEFLEFYAAWWPIEGGGYKTAREECEKLLAGRKNLRDFTQPGWAKGLPKSSLDGGRETVVVEAATEDELGRLSIRKAEQLDGISVVKRLLDKRERLLDKREARFPSVVRVAADPFWRGLDPDAKKSVAQFASDNQDDDLIQRLQGSAGKLYADFPWDFDADLWHEAEAGESERSKRVAELGAGLRGLMGSRRPDGYYTILAADGDKMGEALSDLSTQEEHKQLSEQLAAFATEASSIVRKHRGALVYAGGDDVLAFLPVDMALNCAHSLREAFDAVGEGLPLKKPLTLSVGIAIVHMHENLRTALEFARKAEKAAKNGGRNALAVARHTRGMGPKAPTVVRSFRNEPICHVWGPYAEWAATKVLPSGFPYELRELARELKDLEFDDLDSLVGNEFERILKRKQVPKDRIPAVRDRLTEDLASLQGNATERLADLANTLIIAKHIAPTGEGEAAHA